MPNIPETRSLTLSMGPGNKSSWHGGGNGKDPGMGKCLRAMPTPDERMVLLKSEMGRDKGRGFVGCISGLWVAKAEFDSTATESQEVLGDKGLKKQQGRKEKGTNKEARLRCWGRGGFCWAEAVCRKDHKTRWL